MNEHKFEGTNETCDHFENNRQCCLEREAPVHQVPQLNFGVSDAELDYWESFA